MYDTLTLPSRDRGRLDYQREFVTIESRFLEKEREDKVLTVFQEVCNAEVELQPTLRSKSLHGLEKFETIISSFHCTI